MQESHPIRRWTKRCRAFRNIDYILISACALLPAHASAHMAVQTCAEMASEPRKRSDDQGLVRNAIKHKDWQAVQRFYLLGFPQPVGLTGRALDRSAREYRTTRLLHAAAAGNSAQMHSLIRAGANADAAFEFDTYATPLAWASRCNHAGAANTLIKAGAKVNRRFTYSDTSYTHEGSTALIWASDAGAVSAVKLLLRARANPNFRETLHWKGQRPSLKGETALSIAANSEVRRLLRRSAR